MTAAAEEEVVEEEVEEAEVAEEEVMEEAEEAAAMTMACRPPDDNRTRWVGASWNPC
jgi:hypothetical protein